MLDHSTVLILFTMRGCRHRINSDNQTNSNKNKNQQNKLKQQLNNWDTCV